MASGNEKYEMINALFRTGKISKLSQILTRLPKSLIGPDLDMPKRITDVVNDPGEIKLNELFHLAKLCDMTKKEIFDVTANEFDIK